MEKAQYKIKNKMLCYEKSAYGVLHTVVHFIVLILPWVTIHVSFNSYQSDNILLIIIIYSLSIREEAISLKPKLKSV